MDSQRRAAGVKLAQADSVTMRQLKASLIDRGLAVPVGLTFGDFIAAARTLGFKDSDPLGSIEFGISASSMGHIMRQDDDIVEI